MRTASILQALLGDIGRPGGGILALRGHASIQGSTDIPTLFDLLPGYIPMPHAHSNEHLDAFVGCRGHGEGLLGDVRAYTVSLLKAWWGRGRYGARTTTASTICRGLPAATALTRPSWLGSPGDCKGYFLMGEKPAVGSANGKLQRIGMANLDWLVVRDFSLIESATWWKTDPRSRPGELRTEDIATEVFFLPAAAHTEKDGSFTNTQRMLQWRDKAVEPAGDRAATCGSSITSAA